LQNRHGDDAVAAAKTWRRLKSVAENHSRCHIQGRHRSRDHEVVVGFCSIGPFAVRLQCGDVGEVSLYIDEGKRSRFVGAKILAFIVNEARRRKFRSLISIVSDSNQASIRGCLA
jgi:L-amino acid N-acyltransferase YncA